MPVELSVRIENPAPSTHESLRLDCTLHNSEPGPLTIPSPYDRSGSLQIGVFNGSEGPVRVMDRRTRQFMMSDGRVDSSLDLDTLAPGSAWNWDMDLASYHYTLPPGDHSVRTVYAYEPHHIHAEAGSQPVRVKEDPLSGITVLRDNPIMDGLLLLLRAEGESGPEYFIRQHNYQRPLGAWWSARVMQGDAPTVAFCASSNFHQTESTEPFHLKWVLWVGRNGALRTRCYDRGEPTSMVRQAASPEGRELIPSAICSQSGEILVFFRTPTRALECYRFEHDRLERVFEQEIDCPAGTPLSIGGDDEAIHVAAAARGILYCKFSYSGAETARQQVFRTRLQPYSIRYEPGERRIKGLFYGGTHGKSVHMAVFHTDTGLSSEFLADRLPLRSDLKELDFDQDRSGRFHLLVSTSARRLYYYSEGRGPVLAAEGEEQFFPVMIAPLTVYLGLYRRKYGYRFVQYQRRRQGSKIVGLHP